jgi:hypothetical protein
VLAPPDWPPDCVVVVLPPLVEPDVRVVVELREFTLTPPPARTPLRSLTPMPVVRLRTLTPTRVDPPLWIATPLR